MAGYPEIPRALQDGAVLAAIEAVHKAVNGCLTLGTEARVAALPIEQAIDGTVPRPITRHVAPWQPPETCSPSSGRGGSGNTWHWAPDM
jgi:hypothetical protein